MASTVAAGRGQGSFAGRGAGAATCFKCGKSGHWARDCTAPAGEWVSGKSQGQGKPGDPSQALSQSHGNEEDQQNKPAENSELPKKRPAKKRPKLTWEMITGKGGVEYIYTKLPDEFRKHFKGRGHEARDLGRLLDLYMGWQQQLFPSAASFDQFIADVERFSSQGTVKMELREMRKNVLKMAGIDIEAPAGLLGTGGEAASRDQADNASPAAQAACTSPGEPELDDEELLALQGNALEEELDVVPSEMLDGPHMGNSSAKRDTDGPEAEGLDEEEMEALAEEAEGGLDEEEMAALEEEMFDGHQAEDHPGRGPAEIEDFGSVARGSPPTAMAEAVDASEAPMGNPGDIETPAVDDSPPPPATEDASDSHTGGPEGLSPISPSGEGSEPGRGGREEPAGLAGESEVVGGPVPPGRSVDLDDGTAGKRQRREDGLNDTAAGCA